jgi:hypothetical protein
MSPRLRQIALLLISSTFPAGPAFAAQITAEPTEGPLGIIVSVNGTGWTPDHTIDISWDFRYDLRVMSITADKQGTFTAPIRLPRSAPQGQTYIDAGDQQTFQTAQAPFTVNAAFKASNDYPEPLCPPTPLDQLVDTGRSIVENARLLLRGD